MNSKKKTIIISLAVLIVLIIFLVVLRLTENKDPDDTTSDVSSASSSYSLIEKNEMLFQSAKITNQTDTFTIEAVYEEDENGTAYYSIPELAKYSQRSSRLSSIVGHCCSIYGMKKAASNPGDLSEYGLDNPSATVTVSFADGDTKTISVGDAVYNNSAYYAMVEGDACVYTITTTIAEYFQRSSLYYLETTVTPSFESDDTPNIRKLTVTRTDLSYPLVIEPFVNPNATEETKKLHSAFKLTSPVEIELNSDYDSKLIYNLFGLEGDEVAGVLVSDLSPFGLDNPFCTIELKYDSSVLTLLVGNETAEGSGKYYIMVDGEDIVYTVSASSLTALSCNAEDLITKFPVLPYINSLSQIDLTVNEKSYQYDLTVSQDENGEDVLKVLCNGKKIDSSEFSVFYQLLLDIDITGINSEAVTTEPDMELTYHYASGNTEQVRFYNTGEERKAIVEINSQSSFTGKSTYLTKLEQEAENLLNGKKVDTSW